MTVPAGEIPSGKAWGRETCDGPCGRCDQVWGDTHALGGALMRKRIFGVLASTMFVFAACTGASSPSASSGGKASPPPASTGTEPSGSGEAPSASASGATSSVNDALFKTAYKPVTDATPG